MCGSGVLAAIKAKKTLSLRASASFAFITRYREFPGGAGPHTANSLRRVLGLTAVQQRPHTGQVG
jgi:hypothetical protein